MNVGIEVARNEREVGSIETDDHVKKTDTTMRKTIRKEMIQ